MGRSISNFRWASLKKGFWVFEFGNGCGCADCLRSVCGRGCGFRVLVTRGWGWQELSPWSQIFDDKRLWTRPPPLKLCSSEWNYISSTLLWIVTFYETRENLNFHWPEPGFTPECKWNANAACENEVIVQCRRVTKARQKAFGYTTNIRQTAECYPSTAGTSKRIGIQYNYIGSIRCLRECRTVFECTIHSTSPLVCICHSRSDVNPAWKCKEFLVQVRGFS